MAKDVSIQESQIYGLSPKIMRLVKRKKGYAVFTTFNPDIAHDNLALQSISLSGHYNFVDPEEVNASEVNKSIGKVIAYDNNGNPVYKRIEIKGFLTVDIWNDYETYVYLMLHPDNGSNPFRNPNSFPSFWIKPENAVAKTKDVIDDVFFTVNDLLASYVKDEALQYKLETASNIIATQDAGYSVGKSDTVNTHYKNLLNYARTRPLEVYKALNNDRGIAKEIMYKALDLGMIGFNETQRQWEFTGFTDSYLKVEVKKPTDNPHEVLVDHLLATPDAYKKIKEMIGM